MGSAFDADSDGEEGKYYVFTYEELKDLKILKNIMKSVQAEIGKIKLF